MGAVWVSGEITKSCAVSMGCRTPAQFAGANKMLCGVPLVLYGGP